MDHTMSTRVSPNAATFGFLSVPAEDEGRWSSTERTKAIRASAESDFLVFQDRRVDESKAWYTVVSATLQSGS